MDIYEALYTTRAMRRLKPDPIPYEMQARILDAAIRAPHIGEGWRFLLVDDPEVKSQLAPLYRQGMERLSGAPKVLRAQVTVPAAGGAARREH
jgi:nitroreductase